MATRSPRPWILLPALAGTLWLASCAAPLNFTSPAGPRYAGCAGPPGSIAPAGPATIHVVTFNIKFAAAIDPAITLLERAPELRTADVILLQEMDAPGVRRIAGALGMCYVYYPATVHPATGRDFGPAILARWPMTDYRKLVLPHRARFNRTERVAVGATIDVGGQPIRVYSVHVATGIELGPGSRRDQVRALLADADSGYTRVIVGGDLNAWGLGRVFEQDGYAWPTRALGHTTRFGDVDHIFLRGLALCDAGSVGKVTDNLDASDHDPVWVNLRL